MRPPPLPERAKCPFPLGSVAFVVLATACALVTPGGTIAALGLGSDPGLPLSLLVTKELNLVGTFRFDAEFAQAAHLITTGQIDVRPLITGIHPASHAITAFEQASDKSRAMKVQLAFPTHRACHT